MTGGRLSRPPAAQRYRLGHSGDVILTVLAPHRQPALPPSITTSDAARWKIGPLAECGRGDRIRKIGYRTTSPRGE